MDLEYQEALMKDQNFQTLWETADLKRFVKAWKGCVAIALKWWEIYECLFAMQQVLVQCLLYTIFLLNNPPQYPESFSVVVFMSICMVVCGLCDRPLESKIMSQDNALFMKVSWSSMKNLHPKFCFLSWRNFVTVIAAWVYLSAGSVWHWRI